MISFMQPDLWKNSPIGGSTGVSTELRNDFVGAQARLKKTSRCRRCAK